MKRPGIKALSWFLCLTTVWAAQASVYAQAAAAGADSSLKASASVRAQVQPVTELKFAAAKPALDTTPSPRIKPFTLGASQVFVQTGAEGGQNDPLRADTNFTTDPFSRPPLSSGVNTSRFKLQAEEVMRLLARYRVELLVDRSQSMDKKDCPGGLSRWQWCGEQATGLAQTISPLVPQGLTIVPFATQYDVFNNASPANIESLFNTMCLQFGTRLYEPMAEEFDTYFADRSPDKKPLLIVVITDGVPVPRIEPVLVRKELVDASNRAKDEHEVTVIFCQIGGHDFQGQAYLQDLDQNLGQYGARYPIVHTITFDDLQQYGLGPALAFTLQKYAPAVAAAHVPPVNKQIARVRPAGLAPDHVHRLARRKDG